MTKIIWKFWKLAVQICLILIGDENYNVVEKGNFQQPSGVRRLISVLNFLKI